MPPDFPRTSHPTPPHPAPGPHQSVRGSPYRDCVESTQNLFCQGPRAQGAQGPGAQGPRAQGPRFQGPRFQVCLSVCLVLSVWFCLSGSLCLVPSGPGAGPEPAGPGVRSGFVKISG